MSNASFENAQASASWLKRYYLTRAFVAAAWVALAFTVGLKNPMAAAILLVAYPLYDAAANWWDARMSPTGNTSAQMLNIVVSTATAVAIAIALGRGMNTVLIVFGAWASLAGLLQLIAAVRRWKSGGQWAMVLSGGQSALVGGVMIASALGPKVPTIADIAPYAGLGAFYFLVSGLWLVVAGMRRRQTV